MTDPTPDTPDTPAGPETAAEAFALLDTFGIQDRAGVISVWFTPNLETGQPLLSLEILGGQKRYARIWLRDLVHVGWGWSLGDDSVCLWREADR